MAKSAMVFMTLAGVAAVCAILHVAREVLIPIALAALLTFLLAPVVTRLERWVGRSASVAVVVLAFCTGAVVIGWIIVGQFLDLAKQLPSYEQNLIAKVHSLSLARSSRTFSALSQMLEDIKGEMPLLSPKEDAKPSDDGKLPSSDSSSKQPPHEATPVPVRVVENPDSTPLSETRHLLSGILSPFAEAGLVVLLLACMLAQREDLRNRFIRLVGHGRISATSRAMDDAGGRVSRYLMMQFIMNSIYGGILAVGLYFIGVPNPVLWGVFAALLRYVPYVGIWIAASFPLALSLAVSKDWMVPSLTIGLFLVLEIGCANLLEPLVYGSSTGVSSVALILAAVFWTWIWGSAGLVLSTPLTVCLVVIGTHVRRLRFLSILLSDERALSPAEELYFRLFTPGDQDEMELVDACMKKSTVMEVYDEVLLPVAATAGIEAQLESLEPGQIGRVEEGLRDVLQELRERPHTYYEDKIEKEPPEAPLFPACRVLCIPAHSERDALVGAMLEHLLELQGCEAKNASGTLISGELVDQARQFQPDIVCISAVAPSTVSQARYHCVRLRKQFPQLKIIIGLWEPRQDAPEAGQRLREAGADEVVRSLKEALAAIRKIAPRIESAMIPAPVPKDEPDRLKALGALNLVEKSDSAGLHEITSRVAKEFGMPMGFVGLVDRSRLVFLSQTGLPEELAEAREAPREVTVCGHVVADHEVIVVEDLARDLRFANNPWLRQHGMRFYAGVPLRTSQGLIFGTLCVMDRRPRNFSEHDREQLQRYADDVVKQIEQSAS